MVQRRAPLPVRTVQPQLRPQLQEPLERLQLPRSGGRHERRHALRVLHLRVRQLASRG